MYIQSSILIASLLLTPILSLPTQPPKGNAKRDELAKKPEDGSGPVYTIDNTIGGVEGQAVPGIPADTTQETVSESTSEGTPADTPKLKHKRQKTPIFDSGNDPVTTFGEDGSELTLSPLQIAVPRSKDRRDESDVEKAANGVIYPIGGESDPISDASLKGIPAEDTLNQYVP